MWIDVVLPTYNRAHLLERSVQSVLNQTYKKINLFIVDDGSHDKTAQKLLEYNQLSQVTILRQENLGVSAARNMGIKAGNSPWIAFIDSDDEWFPTKIQEQVQFLTEHPHLRFIHSDEIWVRNGLRVNPKKKFDKSNNDIFVRSLEMCLISPSTAIIQREFCFSLGLFNEDFPVCEDYDLWLKILAFEEVGYIDSPLIKKFGGHDDQLSTKFPAMDFWRIKSMISLLHTPNLSPDKKEMMIEVINKKAPILLHGYLKHNNLEQHEKLMALLSSTNLNAKT